MNTPSTSVSPGLGGFIAFFVLAIALWLLMRNMNARMRRMSYQAQRERDAAKSDRPDAGKHSGETVAGPDDAEGAGSDGDGPDDKPEDSPGQAEAP